MSEPLRWLEDPETSANLHEVLKAAPPAPPMPSALQAQIGAYAAELLSPVLAAKTTATLVGAKSLAPILGGTGVVKASLVIALMGAAGAVGYSMAGQALPAPAAPAPTNASGKARVEAWSPSARTVGRQSMESSPAEPIAAPSMGNVSKGRSSSTAALDTAKSVAQRPETASGVPSAVAAFEEPSIADEAKLLESARTQLGQEPARALEFVQRHLQLYPDGQLSAERELIAVEALLRLGRRLEAQQRAAPRLQQAPESLYARRLRKLLTEGAR